MVTPVPPWFRARKVEFRNPPVGGEHPPDRFPDHARAHPVNDPEERVLGQHRGVERGDGHRFGLVAPHAAEVDFHGISAGRRRRGAEELVLGFRLIPAPSARQPGSPRHNEPDRASNHDCLPIIAKLHQLPGTSGRQPHSLA